MLTGLPLLSPSEAGVGKQYPPARRRSMNTVWSSYERWLHGNFASFYENGVTPRVSANFYKFLVDFWRSAVVPSNVRVEVNNNRAQDYVDAIHGNLLRCIRQVVEDMVTYGVGVFDNRKQGVPEALNPQHWFPVTLPYDYDDGLGNVLMVPYVQNEQGMVDRIRITVLQDGLATEKSHLLEGFVIGEVDASQPIMEYSYSEDTLIPVTLDGSLYGISEFRDVTPYVRELMRRETAISESMDRIADPHLAVAESAIAHDDSGNAVVDLRGSVIPMNSDDPPPQYVTWNGSYESQEEAISRVITRLWWLSGISPSLLDSNSKLSSNVPMSGAALRRLASVTVMKIDSYWEALTPAVEKTVLAQIEMTAMGDGETIPVPDEVNVEWGEPLLVGEEPDAELDFGEERVPDDSG